MIPVVKQDIIEVLKGAEDCISEGNASKLRELSDHTIHNSSIFQDEDSISIAVVIYSLFKICERTGNSGIGDFRSYLHHARKHLEKEEMEKYKLIIRKISEKISTIDSKFRLYVQDVMEKAQVKKGSKLYSHGISIAKASSLLGISQWELMNYIGKTQIVDNYGQPLNNVRERLNFARKLFSR
ncbi:hypothetical protein HYU11_03125 [Candidatus Woesearchaeota archaeon]|nr:hypothetical protein [Candidatus Woesearchaeota archaeon]